MLWNLFKIIFGFEKKVNVNCHNFLIQLDLLKEIEITYEYNLSKYGLPNHLLL